MNRQSLGNLVIACEQEEAKFQTYVLTNLEFWFGRENSSSTIFISLKCRVFVKSSILVVEFMDNVGGHFQPSVSLFPRFIIIIFTNFLTW